MTTPLFLGGHAMLAERSSCMDQESLRLLITALTGLGGTVIGALIGFASAQLAAARTLRGQRVLARDAAIRDARRAAVQPILDLVTTRSNRFYLAALAVHNQRSDALDTIEAELIAAGAPALSYLAIEDEQWTTAVKRLHEAEEQIANLLTGRHRPEAPMLDAQELRACARAYRAAAVDLHTAAVRYWQELI